MLFLYPEPYIGAIQQGHNTAGCIAKHITARHILAGYIPAGLNAAWYITSGYDAVRYMTKVYITARQQRPGFASIAQKAAYPHQHHESIN